MRVTGRILRFDDIRGYGFISPDTGEDDVFLHANDLEIDKQLARSGSTVSFEIEEGPRGKYATAVRLCEDEQQVSGTYATTSLKTSQSDDYYDVLSATEFSLSITEILLNATPPMTGAQILNVRDAVEKLARKYGWVDP